MITYIRQIRERIDFVQSLGPMLCYVPISGLVDRVEMLRRAHQATIGIPSTHQIRLDR